MISIRPFLLAVLTALSGAGISASNAEDAKPLKVGEFSIKSVGAWKPKAEPRMMSQGGFTLTAKEEGKMLDADFYHFGAGGGGGIEANITRWKGQFQPEPADAKLNFERKEITFGKRKTTLVFIKGTFLSGSPLGQKIPLPGHAMIGAIMESEQGDVFVKFTGPEKQIDASKDAFLKLLGTAYPDPPVEAKAAAANDASK